MHKSNEVSQAGATRRIEMLLRGILLRLFAAGALAVSVLWTFEAHFGLLDEFCRVAYPAMLAVFIASAAMLYRWPDSVGIARWIGFLSVIGLLASELIAAMSRQGPLVGNYAFISLLLWLPLAYATAMLMLKTRHAPWVAGALFAFIASVSIEHIINAPADASDTALIVNLLASHVVLLACLSGLIKFKLALVKADLRSHRLFEQASTDPLTGLANRRYGLKMLHKAAAEYSAELPSAVMLCDIDRFKTINDRHGHDVGDQIVLTVAALLRGATRSIDTVVRWGGDEFLIVVPRIGQPALAELAERLRARVAQAILRADDERSVSPSLSIGIAASSEGEAIEDWIKRADAALYRAKAQGRDRCVFAPPAGAGREAHASALAPLAETP